MWKTRLEMLAALGQIMSIESPDGESGGDGEQATENVEQGDPAEQLGEAGKKALAAERKRADEAEKARKALEAQLQAKADESLTETQRLQKQVDELSSKYEAARLDGFRKDAASKAELPGFLARQIEGDSYESMLESAQALKVEFDAELTARTKPGTPLPDPSQGSSGAPDPFADAQPGSARLAAAFEHQLTTNK